MITLQREVAPSKATLTNRTTQHDGLRICLISLHGLVRSQDMELGRDADTGGQIKYVVELAKELAQHSNVEQVELLTRQVIDAKVSDDYAQPVEEICEGARIVRIPFGPKRYLKKEALWPYIEMFVDQTLAHFRRFGIPDVIHGHYADAGLAGAQLSRLLHVPFLFTGHSLGRVKAQRLSLGEQGTRELEDKYKFKMRYEAEETALETASLVVTSTSQEIEQQYELYDHYQPERMEIIPPGVDLTNFSPPDTHFLKPAIAEEFERFLIDKEKPVILTMARPDERKNLEKLVETYGKSQRLQEAANLAIIMGTREKSADLPSAQRKVVHNVLHLIDDYDLYGKIAYPKQHLPSEVPDIYRWAKSLGGVFINPALTEPFGLTLLEAAATGMPIVATNDGGPTDIIANCENGLLVDPTSEEQIETALHQVLSSPTKWRSWSQNGIRGTREHYSWANHARRYLRDVSEICHQGSEPALIDSPRVRRLPDFDRLIVTDLDNTLTGDEAALEEFKELLREHDNVGFGVATGRRLDSTMEMVQDLGLPMPDVLDTDAGTQLHYGSNLTPDLSWRKQIGYAWKPDEIRSLLLSMPGIYPQVSDNCSDFKVSFELDQESAPSLPQIKKAIRAAGLRAKAFISLGIYLDVVPVRGGSGLSLRHLLWKWGFSPERVLVAGDSGNDAGMLTGRTLGVVVGNYSPELERLRKKPRVYFAENSHARGILEGIEHYNFLQNIVIPNDHIES